MTNEEFQAAVLQQLKALASEQKSMASDITNLASEQKSMGSHINNLASEQKSMASDITNLASEQKSMGSEVKEIRKGLVRLENRVENEVIEKIRALFDARADHEDKFKRIDKRLDSIENDTAYLVARVASIERLAK